MLFGQGDGPEPQRRLRGARMTVRVALTCVDYPPHSSMARHADVTRRALDSAGIPHRTILLPRLLGSKSGAYTRPLRWQASTGLRLEDGEIGHALHLQAAVRGASIVHCHGPVRVDLRPSLDPEDILSHTVARMALRRARAIVTNTWQEVGELGRFCGRGVRDKSIPIGTAVSEEDWPYRPEADRDVDALWVGTLSPHKRPLDFVALAGRRPDWTCAMVCSPHTRYPELAQQVEQARPPNLAIIRSPISDESLARIYSRARCYVSTSSAEGYHLPPIESYLSGSAVALPRIQPYPQIWGSCHARVYWYDPAHFDATVAAAIAAGPGSPDPELVSHWSVRALGERLRDVYQRIERMGA